jgi:hypothetical protein
MVTFNREATIHSFSKRLEVDSNVLTVYFNFFEIAEGSYYLISVEDVSQKMYYFQMKKEGAT